MLKNEAERSIKKDMGEYLEENFDSYANEYHTKKAMRYRENLKWGITFASGTLGILATAGGLIILYKKLKKNEDNNER